MPQVGQEKHFQDDDQKVSGKSIFEEGYQEA